MADLWRPPRSLTNHPTTGVYPASRRPLRPCRRAGPPRPYAPAARSAHRHQRSRVAKHTMYRQTADYIGDCRQRGQRAAIHTRHRAHVYRDLKSSVQIRLFVKAHCHARVFLHAFSRSQFYDQHLRQSTRHSSHSRLPENQIELTSYPYRILYPMFCIFDEDVSSHRWIKAATLCRGEE